MAELQVRLFAAARQLAGRGVWTLEIGDDEPRTVAELKDRLAASCPALEPLLSRVRIAIDGEYASDGDVIPHGAELAVIPPVSGGCF